LFVAHAVDIRAMSVVGTIPDGAFFNPLELHDCLRDIPYGENPNLL